MYNRGYFAKPRCQLIACISVCKRGRLGRNRDDSTGDETPQEILQKGAPPGNFRKAQKGEPEFSVSSLELSAGWYIYIYIYDLVPKGVHENRTKGVENKVDDTLKLVVFLECAQC